MQLSSLFVQASVLLALAAGAFASPSFTDVDASLEARSKSCKIPFCKALCPDGTPYNCCLIYVRDPCYAHQLPLPSSTTAAEKPKCTGTSSADKGCVCFCEDKKTSFPCDAQFIRDPCSPLPS